MTPTENQRNYNTETSFIRHSKTTIFWTLEWNTYQSHWHSLPLKRTKRLLSILDHYSQNKKLGKFQVETELTRSTRLHLLIQVVHTLVHRTAALSTLQATSSHINKLPRTHWITYAGTSMTTMRITSNQNHTLLYTLSFTTGVQRWLNLKSSSSRLAHCVPT